MIPTNSICGAATGSKCAVPRKFWPRSMKMARWTACPSCRRCWPFAAKSIPVQARADSTCDTVSASGMRQMERMVHLNGLRCDGAAHGGCQAGCLLFWKEAWLQAIDAGSGSRATSPNGNGAVGRDRAWLEATAIQSATDESPIRYRCQATELKRASRPLPWWKPGQYFRDLFVNKVPLGRSGIRLCRRHAE